MKQNVCRNYKYGYCHFGDNCRYRHVEEICNDKHCAVFACEKRHPKICNFFREFQRCKFTTYCKYKHEKQNNVNENSDKIIELEKKIENLQQNSKLPDLSYLNKEVDKKIETLENKLKIVIELAEEKDLFIDKLEKKLEEVETKFEKRYNDLESFLKGEQESIESLRELMKKKDSENEQLKCDLCDFTTISKKGLKTHMRRKHTEKTQEIYPTLCEICKQALRSKADMKTHMISHTYTSIGNDKCKCEECDYIGNSDWTMQLHHGKCHSKSIECGLCQFEAKDLERLNLHLKTCETYECEKCEHVTKNITEMKKHVKENYSECGSSTIFHIKIDRNDENEANFKEYKQSEIF